MRNRALLHFNKIDDFANYACHKWGYKKIPTKGIYEVLRLKGKLGIIIIYKKNDAKQHATVHGAALHLVKNYLKWKSEDLCKQ
jgi:hypothetical protein